ncbi:MAG TPA: tetratricopeptide repeat protein [Vicinamibacterales bacterium]|nr:tetratricopeptide repeat protein [Vicinamibacterales bacterium]
MAELHPQIVHFTIVLVIVGVGFRLISLLGRPAFAGPAAATLLILAAVTSVLSVQSGTAAHGPVERVPGARAAVTEHEEWGERARNVVLVIGALELLGLAFGRSPKVRYVHAAAAVLGLVGVFAVYEAGKHGGELVYSYAGGVGIRSGDPKDVERLLLAGLYHQSQADRKAGHGAEAANLAALAARQFPADVEVQLMAAESVLIDQKDPQGAIEALSRIEPAADNRTLRTRRATLLADAYEAAGQRDAAISTLEAIVSAFPNPRIQQRLDALKQGGAPVR